MALSRTDFGPYSATPPQGAGPFTTPSFTPPANCKLVIGVLGGLNTPANIEDYILSDSEAHTWSKDEQEVATYSGDGGFIQAWSTDIGASPPAMTLTLTHTGTSSHAMSIYVHAYETDTPGASIQIGAAKASGNQTGGTPSLTLPEAPESASHMIAWCSALTSAADGSGSSIEPGASGGFTEIAESYVNNSFMRTQAEGRTGSTSTTVDWAVTANNTAPFNQRLMVAVEVEEVVSGNVLTVDPGTVAVTGQAAGLLASRRMSVTPASVALSAQNVTLTYSGATIVGGRPTLFGVNLSKIMASAMGPGLLAATLIRKTQGTRAPGSLTAGRNNGDSSDSYSCRGFVDEYRQRHKGAASGGREPSLIQEGDRKITLLGGTLPDNIDPRPGDKITIEGATYTVIGPVKRDPAAATFECQGRP